MEANETLVLECEQVLLFPKYEVLWLCMELISSGGFQQWVQQCLATEWVILKQDLIFIQLTKKFHLTYLYLPETKMI